VAILVLGAFVLHRLRCPKIRNDQRPALLFIEGPADKANLYVAYFDGKTVHRKKIASAKYLQVTQLDNAIFLVTAQHSSTKGSVYAIDFGRGIVKLIARSTRIHCLRAEPQRKTAMLMDSNMGKGVIRLFELNLENFAVTSRHTIRTESLPGLTGTLDQSLRLSPNFKHIVYAFRAGQKVPEFSSGFKLRIVYLSTMEAEDLVSNVDVEISLYSSIGLGIPPFEWINDEEIVFNDMPLDERHDTTNALSIFKGVNIRTKVISECLRKKLPLTLDGGLLRTNPLNGKLICNKKYILDLEKKSLTPKNLPFSFMPSLHAKPTKILYGKDVLYSGKVSCVDSCISASGKNFAYLLYRTTTLPNSLLCAKFKHKDKPVKVGEGTRWPTRPIAWIE
jgi:hypothetical protein